MNLKLPKQADGQFINQEVGKLVTKEDIRKRNLQDRRNFIVNSKNPRGPAYIENGTLEAPSDGVTTMHGPSFNSMHEKRVRASEQRDSLLESLDYQDSNNHERNLKKMFKGTCPPTTAKDAAVTPNKKSRQIEFGEKDVQQDDQCLSADFSPTSTIFSNSNKKSIRLKPQQQPPDTIRNFQIQPNIRHSYDPFNVGSQTQQLQIEIKRALQLAANQRRIERNNYNLYDTQQLPQIENMNSTTGLLDIIRSNRQKSYQQSMQKLKDLELKQHTTLGFLKNQCRQTAAVATKAIIQYSQQQSQGQSMIPTPRNQDNQSKNVLVSRIASDQSNHTIVKVNTKQIVPKYEVLVTPAISPNLVRTTEIKSPVRHPHQPASQINILSTKSNLIIQPMAQTNRETMFQIESRKRAFEDHVAHLQQVKQFYTTNGMSQREQRYHLVIPTVNVSPESLGPSRQTNVSFILNDKHCEVTEHLIPSPSSINTGGSSTVKGNKTLSSEFPQDLKYQLKMNLLTKNKIKPLYQSSNLPLLDTSQSPDQMIHQKDFQQFKYAN